MERERQTDRDRQRQRETDRQTDRDREREIYKAVVVLNMGAQQYYMLIAVNKYLRGHDERIQITTGQRAFSSLHGGLCARGKAHIRSASSLGSFSTVAFETGPVFV